MKSTTFLVRQEEARNNLESIGASLIKLLYSAGPWGVDWPRLLAQCNARAGARKLPDIAPYLLPEKSEFLYRKAGEIAFIIWKKPQKIGKALSDVPSFAEQWNTAIASLRNFFSAAQIEDALLLPSIEVADINTIINKRDSLPASLDIPSFGRCKKDNQAIDLYSSLKDGGSPSNVVTFIVYSFTCPEVNVEDNPAYSVIASLLSADETRARLKPLPASLLTDPGLGHWDLYLPENKETPKEYYAVEELAEPMQARCPADDIQGAAVAIDFGTSSTVVAIQDQGRHSLIRIGASDMAEAPTSSDYENPTVLHFKDFQSLLANWQGEPVRPHVNWDDAPCAHEARDELRAGAKSAMGGLKTWARRKPGDKIMIQKDGLGNEFELKTPEGVDPLEIESTFKIAPLNPLELYAFYLGLYLNNQLIGDGRIYTDYYMTFPVRFDQDTRKRILNSFRRGLIRSLPPSLVYGCDFDISRVTVAESANEPAALAAAMLPLLSADVSSASAGSDEEQPEEETEAEEAQQTDPTPGKTRACPSCPAPEPTPDGVPFGVFDFGGGTADFTVGLYRLPTADEERIDKREQVIEVLDSSGDINLGGEHLLHLLAFEVCRQNMQTLLKNGPIPFTLPEEAPHVPGAERLFDIGAIARANTRKLMEALRPIWEEDSLVTEAGQISLEFENADGEARPGIKLNVEPEQLKKILKERIGKGVADFFQLFFQAFKAAKIIPRQFHILLGGNSCRSPLVQECFQEQADAILAQGDKGTDDAIIIHPPLLEDPTNPEAITLKTGVAIGLLCTLDGEPTGLVMRHSDAEETPFPYCVGPMRRGLLQAKLKRNAPYGEWVDFDVATRQGCCIVLYTRSPKGMEDKAERGKDCHEKKLDWGAEHGAREIVVKAAGPARVIFGLREPDGSVKEEKEMVLD